MFDFRRATVVLFGMLLQFSNSKHKKSKMARRFAKNLGPMEPCSPLGMPIWPPELSLC